MIEKYRNLSVTILIIIVAGSVSSYLAREGWSYFQRSSLTIAQIEDELTAALPKID